jgi:hypothetical protein
MSKKLVASSVRIYLSKLAHLEFDQLLCIGVGDGIGRVWGLKNVQGQLNLLKRRHYPVTDSPMNLRNQRRKWWSSRLASVECA